MGIQSFRPGAVRFPVRPIIERRGGAGSVPDSSQVPGPIIERRGGAGSVPDSSQVPGPIIEHRGGAGSRQGIVAGSPEFHARVRQQLIAEARTKVQLYADLSARVEGPGRTANSIRKSLMRSAVREARHLDYLVTDF
jgi:hypothetical protein